MFPFATSITTSIPAPTSLVATPLPDTTALRASFNAVPPSVSSVEVNNNARGNASYTVVENSGGISVPVSSAAVAQGTAGSAVPSAGVPATFLAQLIGQTVPVGLQGAVNNVLVEYEKLVANSYIKYKPSFATLPPPQPSGVYGRLLGQQKTSPVVATPQPVEVRTQPRVEAQAVQQITPVTQAAPQIEAEALETPQVPQSEVTTVQSAPTIVPQAAASAYQATANRIEAQATPKLGNSA